MDSSSNNDQILPTPANDARAAKTPSQARQDRLLAAGLELVPVTVCLLSNEENTQARLGFHKIVRRAFMQRLAKRAKRETEALYSDQSPEVRDRIRKKRAKALLSYERHHAIPVSLCPIGMSPHQDWDQTLAWWQQEAHRRIHAVPPDFHQEIHVYIDEQIRKMFGTRALSQRPSREFEGEILIPYKTSSVWLPPMEPIEDDTPLMTLPRAPRRKQPPERPVLTIKDKLLANQRERQRRQQMPQAC